MLLEYQLDQIKIVDFLLLAKFWACLLFFAHPLNRTKIKGGSQVSVVKKSGNPQEYRQE